MNMMFDTSRLMGGAKEVKEIYELADTLGYNVIRISGKQYGASQSGVSGFQIGKFGYDSRGYMAGGVLDTGYVYLFPDKNKTKWGFVLDTEHNRRVLASHMAHPILDVADVKVKKEIMEYCALEGINTIPEAGANPYVKKSIQQERLETKNRQLENDLNRAQIMLKQAEEAKEENERAMLRKEQYRDSTTDVTTSEVQINPATGEGETVEVEATTPALNKPAAKNKKVSKADKPLAKTKLKK